MMNEVLNATELHFATKKFTAEDMVTMLEEQGWGQEEMHFAENKISAGEMASMLEGLGWKENQNS